jgi:uncharacterized protein
MIARIFSCFTLSVLSLAVATGALVQEDPGALSPADLQKLEQDAGQGNAEASLRLGTAYAEGRQVARDAVKAEAWLRKAMEAKAPEAGARLAQFLLATSSEGRDVPRAAEGLGLLREAAKTDPEANLALGAFAAQGRFVKQDFAEAERYFEAAAGQGSVKAWFDLGLLHSGELGFEDKIHPEIAVQHLEKALAQGNIEAGRLLVKLYREGRRIPKDDARAIAILTQVAEKGNAEARFALGEAYEAGSGVPADPAQALAAYRQAADLGNPAAQTKLALLHVSGTLGVTKDVAEAKRWLERALEKGFAPAAMNLSLLLDLDAAPGSPEARRVVELLVAAANAGLIDAQDRLGSWYRDGRHVVRDLQAARTWFLLAANAGSLAAKINLAQVLEIPPVQRDSFEAAVKLYLETAEAGHPVGHYHVARLLTSGALGSVDPVQAHAHLTVAKNAGMERAAKPLAELEVRLSEEQKKRSAEFQKSLRTFAWKEGA